MKNMRHFVLTTLFVLFCVSAFAQEETITQTPNNNEQESLIFYHTVEKGQTVYGIASIYNIDKEDIFRLNPNSRTSIKAGERLKIPQNVSTISFNNPSPYIYHTILSGETLYGISKQYNVSGEQIKESNPGLTINTFQAGKTIRIPAVDIETSLPVTETKEVVKELEYTIKKRETIYRICKKFNITSDRLVQLNPQLKSGLKAGMVIKIPVSAEERITSTPATHLDEDLSELFRATHEHAYAGVIRLALLLPFKDNAEQSNARYVEYYQGLLLALDTLRQSGISVDLAVYDIGEDTRRIGELLNSNVLTPSHLIIGGKTKGQIEALADYAAQHKINYVIPFAARYDNITANNAYTFQINTPYAYLYSFAALRGCELFANHNILFIDTGEKDEKGDKSEFIATFKSFLMERGISYHELSYQEKSFQKDLGSLLSSSKPNVITPLSSSLEALTKIKEPLRIIADTKKNQRISLFGYPEWQMYINECLDDFYALDTYIYTPFFANNLSPEVKQFKEKYLTTYKKQMISTYPKYAMLGYDTGIFFLRAIDKYGLHFEDYARNLRSHSIQNGFNYNGRMNNWGGFINQHLYIVNFNKQQTIIRSGL